MRRFAPIALLLLATSLLAQQSAPAPDARAALAQQLQPSPAPAPGTINLARTSLASIAASGVNGHRELNNEFYGIQKAFDNGGKPRPDGLLYHYWLAEAGDNKPWIEIRFDQPVEIHQIIVQHAPAFRAEFQWNGDFELAGLSDAMVGEFNAWSVNALGDSRHAVPPFHESDQLKLDKPAKGVHAVRLTFVPNEKAEPPVRVDEIQILGIAPDAKFTTGDPRLIVGKPFATNSAQVVFNEFRYSLLNSAKPEITETPDAFVILYRADNLDLARVTVNKTTGQSTLTPLVSLQPVPKASRPKGE